jgi:glycosyltransferase involved in cell wall biosynthesis
VTAAPRRRIAVVVKGYPRLSETFIAQELRGLEEAGLDLVIVSLRHPTDRKRHPVHDQIRAPVIYLPEYLYQEPGRVLRGLWAAVWRRGFGAVFRGFLGDLRRDFTPNRVRRLGQAVVLAREFPAGCDWIYAHFIHTPASVADYAGRMLGVPVSVSAHAKDIWTLPDWELAGKLARVRWAVTCTRTGYDHLRALAADPSCVHLSYHGLNLSAFGPNPVARPPRDGSRADDPVTILSVGRAVPKKGYDVLLRALALLPGDLHWRFVHIGGGEERPALKALAVELGLGDRVLFEGAMDQSEVLAAYRKADLFALACRIMADGDRDGLPNVLVEAASQRLCCVSTTISAIPELFTDGENGLLVPPEDPAALALALVRAIGDPDLRGRLGADAEARVRTTLDYHRSIAQLVGLFGAEVA